MWLALGIRLAKSYRDQCDAMLWVEMRTRPDLNDYNMQGYNLKTLAEHELSVYEET